MLARTCFAVARKAHPAVAIEVRRPAPTATPSPAATTPAPVADVCQANPAPATSAQVVVTQPAASAQVTSPLTVSGSRCSVSLYSPD